jgi:hypothetical protein
MARLNLGGDNFAFNGFLGPSFGFALSGTQRFEYDLERTNGQGDESDTETEKLDYDKDLSRFDISALAGVGFSIGAGPGKITFDVRYILGISDLTKEDDIDDRIKNRAFQIGAGYIVRL